ncbi:MAG TPA: GNAT family N-acetyltransferase, partial [Solirubrobacterales bacterium]|nr:GNAT family N-acetyltransferase [Solirubrobacterales bacterium]
MSPPPIDFPVRGLEGGGIRLRLMAEADVEDVVVAAQDPDLQRFTTVPDAYGEDEARQWRRTSQAGIDSGTDLTTVIVDAEDGGVLGARRASQHRPRDRAAAARARGGRPGGGRRDHPGGRRRPPPR